MKKCTLVIIALISLVLNVSVQAVEMRAVTPKPILSFSGTTAYCYADCIGSSDNDIIDATLTLYNGSTQLDSWSKSAKGSVLITGQSKVQSGKTYKLTLTYSVNGLSKPSVSVSGTCP